MGDGRGAYMTLVGKPEGRNHLEDLGADGRIILNLSSRNKTDPWTGLIWLRK